MTTPESPHPAPRLPLWSTVLAAHVTTLRGVPAMLRMGWTWIALVTVLVAAYYALIGWPVHRSASFGTGLFTQLSLVGGEFVALLAGVALAVKWHRHVLLGERQTPQLRVDGVLLRYYGWAAVVVLYYLLLTFILGLIVVSGWFITETLAPDVDSPGSVDPEDRALEPVASEIRSVVEAVAYAGLVVALCVLHSIPVVRLAPLLPALALGHAVTPGQVWRRTRGQFWRLFTGIVACGLVLLAGITAVAVVIPEDNFVAFVTSQVVVFWIALITGMVGVTFLSYTYRHLFPEMFPTRNGGSDASGGGPMSSPPAPG